MKKSLLFFKFNKVDVSYFGPISLKKSQNFGWLVESWLIATSFIALLSHLLVN